MKMNCPDIDRLIDSLHEGNSDLEVEAHARYCRDCQSVLSVLRLVRAELEAQETVPLEVPEELIQRTIAAIPFPEPSSARTKHLPLQLVGAGALGAVTALAAIVAAGAADAGTTIHLLTFVSLGGLAAAALEWRFVQRPEPGSYGPP
jgi:hypothetical protein